jgi:RNA polymerase sigma-70 factor (ECF subfamily)
MAATVAGFIAQERVLLEGARGGDGHAFGGLVGPYRPELHAHCYRMLGSVHDADDALQDTLLRAWRGLGGFDIRRPLRPWLYKIATNACLDAIASRPRRWLPTDYGAPVGPGSDAPAQPHAEPVWVEPYPDQQLGLASGYASPEARYEQREAVELAFIAALQHLPARQRAVLILRDVLGLSAREVAAALDTTTASVNSALQRARETAKTRLSGQSQQSAMRSLGDKRLRDLVQRFTDALEAGRVEVIVAMLTEDARFAMPPYPGWYRGRGAVSKSWLMPSGPPTGLRICRPRPMRIWRSAPTSSTCSKAAGFRPPSMCCRCGTPASPPSPPSAPLRSSRASASRTGFPRSPVRRPPSPRTRAPWQSASRDCHIEADPLRGTAWASVNLIFQHRLGIWVNLNVNEPETMKAHNQAFCTRPPPPRHTSS